MKRKLILLGCLSMASMSLTGIAQTFTMSIGDVVGEKGSTVMMNVYLDRDINMRDMQVFIKLPEGIEMLQPVADPSHPTHNCSFNPVNGGIAFAGTTEIAAGSGLMLSVPLKLDDNLGTYGFWTENTYVSYMDDEHNAVDVPVAQVTGTITIVEASEPIAQQSAEDYQLYANNIELPTGPTSGVLDVAVRTDDTFKELSCTIVVPEGITVDEYEEDGVTYPTVDASSRVTKVNIYGDYDNGNIAITTEAGRGASIAAGDGVVFSIPFTANLAAGIYDIVLKDQDVAGEPSADFTVKLIVKDPLIAPANANTVTFYNRTLTAETPANEVGKNGDGEWAANEIALTDAINLPCIPYDVYATKVTYSRNFKSTNWQALFVPFDVQYNEWRKYGDIAILDNVEGTAEEPVLVWRELDEYETLHANTPYIVKPMTTGNVDLTLRNYQSPVTAVQGEYEPLQFSNEGATYTLLGTYTLKDDMATSHAYALSSGEFRPTDNNAKTLSAFRIYLLINTPLLKSPQRIKNRIVGTGGVDIITDIDTDIEGIDMYYDLQGRPVERPDNGIYVTGNKKVYIK